MLSGNTWIILGVIGLAFSGFAIPYGFHLKDKEKVAAAPILPPPGTGGDAGSIKNIEEGGVGITGKGGQGGVNGYGGHGGGIENIGKNALGITGDGGSAGRADGRGGKGAESPLRYLSPEKLKEFGLREDALPGAGGNGANTPEYNRRVNVLTTLSLEYSKENPNSKIFPMQGINMPPVEWVNKWLAERKESFRITFIDNNTDFDSFDFVQ